jgi:hypothetical protein
MATPTSTPEPDDPCPFCPEDADDFQIEPTPVIICTLCLNPEFDAQLPDLAFEETMVKHCGGFVLMTAELNRNAEVWVEYTNTEGDNIESEHQFGMSFVEHDTGKWIWFGSWGWFYPYSYTFYAEDSEGNQMSWQANPQGC